MDEPPLRRLRRESATQNPIMQNRVFVMVGDEIASKVEFDIGLCDIAWVRTYAQYAGRGYATLAVSDAIDWLRESGRCQSVSLYMAPQYGADYQRLYRFYRRLGFRPASWAEWRKTWNDRPCRLVRDL
jgi:GNAT superfamily N-acetyltransferase